MKYLVQMEDQAYCPIYLVPRRVPTGRRTLSIVLQIDTRFGSHNACYVMRANSSALTLRLVWQSS